MTIFSTGAYDLPALADRNRNSLMLAAGDTPLSVKDGIHSGFALSKTTGMGFAISPGRAAVNGASAADGTYTAVITSPEVGAFEPGDAVKDRIDLIVLQTYPDNPSGTGVKVEVVKGALPTSGQVGPTPDTPPGAMKLFSVIIRAGVSAGNGGWNYGERNDFRRTIGVPEFQTYTPSWGGFQNIGTGAVREGRWRLDGDKCSVNVHLRGGVGAVMGTEQFIKFTLPFPAVAGWMYYGVGAIHHTGMAGLAYDLRILSEGALAAVWAPASTGALIQPAVCGYPFGEGTELFANLEYIVDTAQLPF